MKIQTIVLLVILALVIAFYFAWPVIVAALKVIFVALAILAALAVLIYGTFFYKPKSKEDDIN